MQHLEGLCRKAIQMYNMIQPDDTICVGVSGGKDSVALTLALQGLARYFEHPFSLHALTLDPCFGGVHTDYSELSRFFAEQNIPHTIQRTDIGTLVFDVRREQNPCALCAKMRRGTLHRTAKQLGCNKVALGHHLDDAIETFFMNLFGGGRLGCFSPVTHLSRQDITLIRPMVLASEGEVAAAASACDAPVVRSTCPVDGHTARAEAKQFVHARAQQDSAFHQKMLGALQKEGLDGWAPIKQH